MKLSVFRQESKTASNYSNGSEEFTGFRGSCFLREEEKKEI